MSYGVGIIGLGIMGQRMLQNMSQHPAFEVVSAYDPRESEIDLSYAHDASSLINNANVDLVYIACPPAYHAAYAVAAAQAGKPVFCEKPLAVDVQEAKTLTETFEQLGIPNAVNFSFASSPSRAFLRSKFTEGDLGTVEAIDIRLHFAKWPRDWQAAAKWLALREQGGYVREVLSHFIYLTQSIFGELRIDSAHVRYPDGAAGTAAETHVYADLDCGGIPVSVAGGAGGTGPDHIEYTVWGTDSSCRLDDWYTVYTSSGDAWVPDMTEIGDPRQVGRVMQLNNLAHFLSGAPHELPDFKTALSTQIIIEGILP